MDMLVKAADFTWAMAEVFIWSCCEPFVGIVCACLPTYAPLFRRWWTTLNTKRYGSASDQESKGYNPDTTKVRLNKAKREWNRLHGNKDNDPKLRCDDEVELTNNISGGRHGSVRTNLSDDNNHTNQSQDIVVKKDISWHSGPRPTDT